MTFGDLFAGIGGFRLGLERAGHECKWACEINPKRRAIYELNVGHTPQYRDIRECIDPPYVDIITGGFPCQPFSVAGKRKGSADDRNLWPEMLRVIEAVRPMWVVGENVPGIGDYLNTVVDDLEAIGYETLPLEIPAAAFGAPHLRYRVFIVSHAVGQRGASGTERSRREAGADFGGRCEGAVVADATGARSTQGRCQESRAARDETRRTGSNRLGTDVPNPTIRTARPLHLPRTGQGTPGGDGCQVRWDNQWATEPDVGRVAHGIPGRVDRLAALGDAVVPQVVEWIGRRLKECE